MNKKKIAFVVQRYGLDVNGGAELHCRHVAERLTKYYDVEVITSCAKDYYTWKNEYKKGIEHINNVKVRRFKVDYERTKKIFDEKSNFIFNNLHTLKDEDEWMRLQGPFSTKLLKYIYENQNKYHKFIFFTYLYATTYYGLPLVHHKSILVPTSHDEPPIYLDIFKPFFHIPKIIFYNTEEEKKFIEIKFNNIIIKNKVIGIGFDFPENLNPHKFKRKYKIKHDFVLYVGRIDESKGCRELFDYFLKFKKESNSKLKLVLIGKKEMKITSHKDILYFGIVSETDKINAMAAARALINPSYYESFSMVILESMSVGTPVIVNGDCDVLKGHINRSKNGLLYTDYHEFKNALDNIVKVKVNKNYVNNYKWTNIIKKIRKLIDK